MKEYLYFFIFLMVSSTTIWEDFDALIAYQKKGSLAFIINSKLPLCFGGQVP